MIDVRDSHYLEVMAMQFDHEVFRSVSPVLTAELKRVSEATSRTHWQELLKAVDHLNHVCPDGKFRDEPYVYPDLKSHRLGFIFIESDSEDAYFVFGCQNISGGVPLSKRAGRT